MQRYSVEIRLIVGMEPQYRQFNPCIRLPPGTGYPIGRQRAPTLCDNAYASTFNSLKADMWYSFNSRHNQWCYATYMTCCICTSRQTCAPISTKGIGSLGWVHRVYLHLHTTICGLTVCTLQGFASSWCTNTASVFSRSPLNFVLYSSVPYFCMQQAQLKWLPRLATRLLSSHRDVTCSCSCRPAAVTHYFSLSEKYSWTAGKSRACCLTL